MLKRIRVRDYKSLVDLEVSLKPLTVIFGTNAAGKSNFLDALQLLSRLTTSRSLKEAFDPPYRGTPLESFTFREGGIQELLTRESASFEIEADLELSDQVVLAVNTQIREMRRSALPETDRQKGESYVKERSLRYRIKVQINPKTGFLTVADEYVAALSADGQPTGKRKPFLERIEDRLHLRMEGQSHPTHYELFLNHSILSLPIYPPHYPHLTAVRREFESWLLFYFEPRERMRSPGLVKEARHIGLMGEDLASYLNTLKVLQPRQFKAVERALHTLLPTITGIEVGPNSMGEVEFRLNEGGVPIPARVLSEGTLRMIGLLALSGAKEPPSLIGFEEPENGIHPRRIEQVAELLKSRTTTGGGQIIVTTHSPVLADQIAQDSLYICTRTNRQTKIKPFSPLGGIFPQTDEIKDGLKNGLLDREEEDVRVSERMLRGDFDAAA